MKPVYVPEVNLNDKMHDPTHVLYSEVESFDVYGLPEDILKGILVKFKKPSRIQALTLPLLLKEKTNLIAQSQSGTGKTLCFAIAMLASIDRNNPNPQSLCLLPSLELAVQVAGVVEQLAQFTNIKVTSVLAGEKSAKVSGQILIGTPGKVKDLLKRKLIDSRDIKLFVLDEADQMLEESMNSLRDQTITIKQTLPDTARVLLFSATFRDPDVENDVKGEEKDKVVMNFAHKVVPEPVKSILLQKEKLTLEEMKQFAVFCKSEQAKVDFIKEVFETLQVGQSMIFVNRKETARHLAEMLDNEGFTVAVIRGDLQAAERKQAMDEFRKGNSRVLVATNAAARGIDIASVTHVINFDLPNRVKETNDYDYATYLHRIGRTARFGKPGYAISLYTNDDDKRMIKSFEKFYQTKITEISAEHIEEQIK
jgi:ATP-dependent RNA helicase DDX19/DBP5